MPTNLPKSISKRDGRLVPFEPEKLSRSLFAATEVMNAPDAFLARELTDSVLHFLSLEEFGQKPPTTAHLAEVVATVIRELGHPVLAKTYFQSVQHVRPEKPAPRLGVAPPADRDWISPNHDPFSVIHRAARAELSHFSLRRVYPRDLASAHCDGLLHLMDVGTPQEIVGIVLSAQQPTPVDAWELLKTLVDLRQIAGSLVAFDGPERTLVARQGIPEELAGRFAEALDRALWLSDFHGILNLNVAEPPAWAAPISLGPLFPEYQKEIAGEWLDRIALFLLRRTRRQTVFWHLAERDFLDEGQPRLGEIISRASARDSVEFVFDRPNRPVILGPGMSRACPAALGMVGVNLPRFVDQLGGGPIEQDIFLKKLGSLARFAKSAGYARQDFLRKQGRSPLHEGFLLERAVEIVLPIGVMEAAQKILGDANDVESIAELARRIMETIRVALDSDQLRTMATCIDTPLNHPEIQTDIKSFAANDPISKSLLPRQQLRYGSALLAAAGGGCLTIRMNRMGSTDVSIIIDLLKTAWRGDVTRLRFAWED